MRRFFFPIVMVLGGCDSLHARFVAQEAVDLYHRGNVPAAAQKFEEAAKLDGNIAPIQLDLGFANLAVYQASPKSKEGEAAVQKAIAAFEKYLLLKPGEERASGYLVQTFIDTGRYDDAVAYFKPQIEKNEKGGNVGEMIGTLGTIASKTGRFKEAREWYEKRVEVEPNKMDARLAVGVLLWDYLHNHSDVVGPERLAMCDAAQKTLDEAIKLNPNAPNPYTYMNLVYRERSMAEATDDAKRVDIEQANKYFLKAQALQKAAK